MDGGTARSDMFALKIKVEGFVSTDAGVRKAYTKGKVIKWDVEVGGLTLDLLLSSLANEVKYGENQAATVWFHDKRLGEDVKIVTDVQMIDLFEMYKSEMHCQVVVSVLDKSVCEAHEYDDLQPICVVPPDEEIPHDDVSPPNMQISTYADPEACEGVSASEAAAEEADALKLDLFDNEEEYVGVNDEHLYIPTKEEGHTREEGHTKEEEDTCKEEAEKK